MKGEWWIGGEDEFLEVRAKARAENNWYAQEVTQEVKEQDMEFLAALELGAEGLNSKKA